MKEFKYEELFDFLKFAVICFCITVVLCRITSCAEESGKGGDEVRKLKVQLELRNGQKTP